jgi:cytochrome b pre-mRNA-processing protein 3
MRFLHRLFRRDTDPRDAYRPLYDAVVARGRAPAWYLDGAPDTLDGRFDMIAAILAHVLIRLESDPAARQPSVHLAELFVDDMDGQLRQIGIGDMIVGKHIGKMMSALGGRLTVYRNAGGDAAALRAALVRNLWQGDEPGDGADAVTARLMRFTAALVATPVPAILQGALPDVPA